MNALLALVLGCVVSASAWAARGVSPPTELRLRAGFDARLGASTPAGLAFRDQGGHLVSLMPHGDGRPTILALGYFGCPNLCDTILHSMAHTASLMALQPGRDYRIAFVSINPDEGSADAATAAAALEKAYPAAEIPRWQFLSGDQAAIASLAESVGYRYFYDERNQQYAHPAGVIVLSPQGIVTDYLLGASFSPPALEEALSRASRGRVSRLFDHVVLLCTGYDPSVGRHSAMIGRVVRIVGLGFLVLSAGILLRLRRRELA